LAEFWNESLTKKSWKTLIELSKEPFSFVLIGGWATYLWTKQHKSKDIDIVLKDLKDLDYLKKKYELKKNENLKKYEIVFDDIDLDIYVPYFSKLSMPPEDLNKYSTKIENITVAKAEALLILKQGAELGRKNSVKGEKDRIDILSLLCFSDTDFKVYFSLLKQYKIEHYFQRLVEIIKNFKDLKYLGLNPREMKLKKKDILEKLKLY
jgi:phosphoenolpyruvate synthase/pyruvate phosphate dikinase